MSGSSSLDRRRPAAVARLATVTPYLSGETDMTTSTTRITARSFARLPAASVDAGYDGMPGTAACRSTCELYARRDGRWDAVGAYSSGQNQGYYQETFSYGPWEGRGDTPEAAVRAMVARADDDHRDAMRRAGHDACLEVDGRSWADLVRVERDRIRDILERGERDGCRYARLAGRQYKLPADERAELRRAALKVLDRLIGADANPLADVEDDVLLAEVERRGLMSRA